MLQSCILLLLGVADQSFHVPAFANAITIIGLLFLALGVGVIKPWTTEPTSFDASGFFLALGSFRCLMA